MAAVVVATEALRGASSSSVARPTTAAAAADAADTSPLNFQYSSAAALPGVAAEDAAAVIAHWTTYVAAARIANAVPRVRNCSLFMAICFCLFF